MDLALEFARDAQRTASARELGERFKAATVALGFDCFGLVRCDETRRADEDDIHFFSFPRNWTDKIHQNNLFRIDPIRAAARVQNKTFPWMHVDKFITLTPQQKEMMSASVDAGLAGGYAIPIDIDGEVTGVCSFGLRGGRDFPYGALAAAEIVGRFAFEAARRLKARNERSYFSPEGNPRKRNAFLNGLLGLNPGGFK